MLKDRAFKGLLEKNRGKDGVNPPGGNTVFLKTRLFRGLNVGQGLKKSCQHLDPIDGQLLVQVKKMAYLNVFLR